jgi:hypothetical protein
MYYKFKSDVTRFGPILTPYELEIDDYYIRYSRRNKNLINKDKMTISIDNVAAIKANSSILGTTLTISSFGGEDIIIKKMNIQDAYVAQEVIENRKRELKRTN